MGATQIIECRDVSTAEELIAELSPATSSLWRITDYIDDEVDWMFRGQSNGKDGSIWSLLPSAFRPDAFLKFAIAQVKMPGLGAAAHRQQELNEVLRFASVADRHGFVIPGDRPELRDERAKPGIGPAGLCYPFPPPDFVALFGLAQHYGVPTRLLDWTWKPLVAAYFAAESVARRREPGVVCELEHEAPFSVFALRRAVVHACQHLDPEIHLLTVPTATNANLHAQGGLFSLVQPREEAHPLPLLDRVLQQHADKIRTRDDGIYERLFPFLIEFRVPAREARTMMLTLSHYGVTGASIYPGLRGVVQTLEESRYYQWAGPHDRS